MTETDPEEDWSALVGGEIRRRRELLRLSQAALGTRTGTHRNYVGSVERGEVNPTLATLFRLARGLGVAPSEVLREVEKRASRGSRRRDRRA